MTSLKSVGLFLVISTAIFSCTAKHSEVQLREDGTPVFYTTPPVDNSEYLYTVDSHISCRRDMARRQAILKANTNMATKLASKVEALDLIFQEDVSDGNKEMYSAGFTLASRQITSAQMTGASAYQTHFMTDNEGRYECFVLVRMPVGEARKKLLSALSQDEELYNRFKESKAFNELQNSLESL